MGNSAGPGQTDPIEGGGFWSRCFTRCGGCCGGCRDGCCKDSCLCCQTTPGCSGRCTICCRDLCCRDFYARPPVVRTLQPVGGNVPPPTATAMAFSQVRPTTVVTQTTVTQQTYGPGIVVGPPHVAGPPITSPYQIGMSRVSGSGGPSMGPPIGGYTGPVVPRDPRVPMAGIDMY